MNNTRPRSCGVVIRDGGILMVRHRHDDGREYWTLPGGAVEPCETWEQAAVREMREETGLKARVVRFLFEEPYAHGDGASICHCFLLSADDGEAVALGYNPEETKQEPEARVLQEVAWLPLDTLKQDGQVAQVLRALPMSPVVEQHKL